MTESQIGTHYSPADQRASDLLAAVDWEEIQLERILHFEDLVIIYTLHRPKIFNTFMHTTLDHQDRNIDVKMTRQAMETLFADFPVLLNYWRGLPYHQLSHHQPSDVDATMMGLKSQRQKDACHLLNRVREEFRKANASECMYEFLETLKSWRAQTIDTIEMRTSCFKLLKPFPNLIMELNGWLPPDFEVDPSAYAPMKKESIKEEEQ